MKNIKNVIIFLFFLKRDIVKITKEKKGMYRKPKSMNFKERYKKNGDKRTGIYLIKVNISILNLPF